MSTTTKLPYAKSILKDASAGGEIPYPSRPPKWSHFSFLLIPTQDLVTLSVVFTHKVRT